MILPLSRRRLITIMDRDTLQSRAASKLDESRRLLCTWATGVGKSGIVLKFLQKHPDFTCLILVPESNNIDNWLAEFDKFGISTLNVQIACYASIHKYKDTNWDLIVFDEMPHLDTYKRLTICRSLTGKFILALGAVIDDDERSSLQSVYGNFREDHIPLHLAIQYGLLPEPRVNILHVKLDDTEKRYWSKGRVYTALDLYTMVTEKVKRAVDMYNASSSEFNRRKMLSAGSERKRLLGSLKQEKLRMLCQRLKEEGKRFICFCSSIQQAEMIGEKNAFTSKTPASAKLIERFNHHEIDSLYVVGKLIEGQNLRDIDCGILNQLGGTQRITIQECGRIMRSQNPVIYVLVMDESKDDSFLYTLTSSVPEKYIKHYNF